MQPGTERMVAPDLLIWMVLPPERQAAVVALLAMLAARAAGRTAGGGRDEPGRLPAAGAAAAEDPPGAPGPGCGGLPVRQSSRQQVLEHTESTRLQYALAGRAVALGWARSQVTVIDDDLGVSAATDELERLYGDYLWELAERTGQAGREVSDEWFCFVNLDGEPRFAPLRPESVYKVVDRLRRVLPGLPPGWSPHWMRTSPVPVDPYAARLAGVSGVRVRVISCSRRTGSGPAASRQVDSP